MLGDAVIDSILEIEGGYSDHPSDSGGPTMHGITEVVARANGWTGPMQELPVELARDIYRNRYINDPGFDKVALVDEDIANELIDTGVNMGPTRAALFLQRCLNVFNKRGSRYADLHVDGRIGPVTQQALENFLAWRGREGKIVMLKALNCVQGTRYIELAENNESQEDFAFGWFKRVELAHG